ncbi:hypoxanthine phosphoribosyltransferase [bacterium]|nr:hypoxanthine phosphoribosyltransferase [bacterium]
MFTHVQISEMVTRIARSIEKQVPEEEEIVCIGVLKGAWIFHSDLVREIKRPVSIDFVKASSYGNQMISSGVVRIEKDIETDIQGKHVFLVEDIIDTGRTLKFLKARLSEGGAKSVSLVALLDKKVKREVDCDADLVGAVIEDKFVVGYGLDWAERYRTLPDIHFVPEDYAK